ncbi:MAG: glycosyl hydrolase family 18 protein, partial [Bryobacteraceae bacterium]
MRIARNCLLFILFVNYGFALDQPAHTAAQAAKPRTGVTATASTASGGALPTFTDSFNSGGNTYPYTMVGGSPQAGGTTTIPTVILPVSFVFDEYLDANGDKIVLDAIPVVPNVVQSPIFQNYPFSTGNTQYGDAMQRAEFWNVMGNNWHTLLGQPTVLPAVQIEITPSHAYVMQSQSTGENFAVVDVVFVENALSQALGSLLGTAITPGQLGIGLFRNTAFYGTTLPADALWAEDPTVCCSFGQHGVVGTTVQPYVIASYIDPGLLPQIADGMAPQSSAALPIASDVQAVSEQIVEWLNDPFSGTSSANYVPYWKAPLGEMESCAGVEAGDFLFSAEPADFLLPSQAAYEVSANGFTYHFQNAALLPWYEQAGSSAAFNGAYSYPDTSVLTGPAQSCNASVPIPTVPPLPQGASNGHALIGYWESYLGPDIFFPLSEVSPQFDVVIVSFASPVQGSTSLLQFNPPSEQTAAQFMADIKSLQSQGKKVLISLGGGGAVVTLNTAADIQNFVTSVAAVIQQYGFDGIDLDIENPSIILDPGDTDFRNPTTPSILNLMAACRQLHNQFGSGFMLAMVPEVAQ